MPSPLESLYHTLLSLRNRLDYPLRQGIRFRRGGLRVNARPHGELFAHLPGEQRRQAEQLAERLIREYRLEQFAAQSTPENFRENLFYLHMLETALEASQADLPDPVQAVDVGASSWFYVQALAALLRWWRSPQGREVSLSGYEVDAYRVYNNLHSRYDHAMTHLHGLTGAVYIPEGFRRRPAVFHLATMLFPFVFPRDHLRWGLPAGMFDPRTLLEDVWASLKPGGVLVIVNQGPQEHDAQGETLQACGIQPRAGYRQEPLLYSYPYERYVWIAVRER